MSPQWTPSHSLNGFHVTQWPPLGLFLQTSWFIFWLPCTSGAVRSSQKPGAYIWKSWLYIHRNHIHRSSPLLYPNVSASVFPIRKTAAHLYGLASCCTVWYQLWCFSNVDKGDQTALSGIWGRTPQMTACFRIYSQTRATSFYLFHEVC